MEIPKKEQKVFDFFLFWNENDTLLLRLNELNPYVTNFIIIEFDLNFKLNQYKKFLDLGSEEFDNFREKITHLKLEFKNHDEYYISQMKKLKVDYLDLHEKFFIKTFNEIQIFLENYSVDFEDIIMFSHIDEIPNLENLEKIKELLVYGPVILKNHNFVHTTKYYQENCHIGTQIYNHSMIIRNTNILFETHRKKLINDKNLPVTFIKNGWHLSHFHEIEKVVDNLNNCSLIYNKRFSIEDVKKTISKLSPLTKNSPKEKFKKTGADLPKNIKYVDQNLEFPIENFSHLIAIETDEIQGDFSSIRIVNFTENPILPFETESHDGIFQYNLLLPIRELYESEDFFREYKLNEIKLVIQWFEPLDTDKIVIKTKSSEKEFFWSEIKEKEFYTII